MGLFGEVDEEQKRLLDWMVTVCRHTKFKSVSSQDRSRLPLDYLLNHFPIERGKIDDLTSKGYLSCTDEGYRIATGQLSFEVNCILFYGDVCPTITTVDLKHMAIVGFVARTEESP